MYPNMEIMNNKIDSVLSKIHERIQDAISPLCSFYRPLSSQRMIELRNLQEKLPRRKDNIIVLNRKQRQD